MKILTICNVNVAASKAQPVCFYLCVQALLLHFVRRLIVATKNLNNLYEDFYGEINMFSENLWYIFFNKIVKNNGFQDVIEG